MIEGPFGDSDDILIFPNHMTHSSVAAGFNVISAGFLTIQDGKVGCFGRSVSLNVDSRDEDTAIAARALGLRPQNPR